MLEPLPANLPKTCQQVYEVPGTASGLQARVGDLKLFGAKEALVALGISDPGTATTSTPAAAELAADETGVVGQDIKVGDVRWKVLEATDAGQSLTTPGGNVTTAGKLLRVRVEVENLSSAQLNFTDLELSDSSDRTFQTASSNFELLMAIPDDERCNLMEALPANLPQTCQVFFELPADAAGLKLKVGDLKMFGAKEAVIDLGL